MSQDQQDCTVRLHRWRQQAARYRSLSRLLLLDPDDSSPLAALARGIEEQIQNLETFVGELHMHQLQQQIVAAELDTALARVRTIVDGGVAIRPNGHFTADDVREEGRLCLEEAEATEDAATKRLMAARADQFGRLAKRMPGS